VSAFLRLGLPAGATGAAGVALAGAEALEDSGVVMMFAIRL
jgi:hypothetical protein